MDSKTKTSKDVCAKFDSDEWKEYSNTRKKECNNQRRAANTTSFLVWNTTNMLIVAVIGGFVFALALIIFQSIQENFVDFPVWEFALIMFLIIMGITLIQFFVDKRKKFYEKQLD